MKDNIFYVPLRTETDWKILLREEKHWKDGYSAKSLARTWLNANGLPPTVASVFKKCGYPAFEGLKPIVAFPEYKVKLDTEVAPSQTDLLVICKSNIGLFVIAVEGKGQEGFDKIIAEWKDSRGKERRLNFLANKLEINTKSLLDARYQLVHRTTSAIIQAERFLASHALMLIHAFEAPDDSYWDFVIFAQKMGIKVARKRKSGIFGSRKIKGISIYLGWVDDSQHTRLGNMVRNT